MYRSEEHFEADEDYDAMGTYDAGREDVENTIDQMKMSHPTMTVDKDSVMYLTYQSGSSNKFHVFFLAQDKSGNWFAFNGYARIGYSPRIQRIYGPASREQCRRALNTKIVTKKRKGYTDYFQGQKWYATAESYGAEMQYMDLPVIPDSYGNDSATEMGGRGVPVWYGSAETFDAHGSQVCSECKIYGYWDDNPVCPMCRMKKNAEGMEMTPDIEGYPGLPVVPDSYGTNSALESGQGVPVWYGSAETDFDPYNLQNTADNPQDYSAWRMSWLKPGTVGGDMEGSQVPVTHPTPPEGGNGEGDNGGNGGGSDEGDNGGAGSDEHQPQDEESVSPSAAETEYMKLPVIPDSYGTDSATEMGGRGVPVWYGSAEAGSWDYPERARTAYLLVDNSGSATPAGGGGLNTFKDSARRTIDRLTKHIKEITIIPMSSRNRGGYDTKSFTDKKSAKKYVNSLVADGATLSMQECMETINPPPSEYADDYTFLFTDEKVSRLMMAETFEALPQSPDVSSAEDANPSGGSTGNQVVSWEHGGLSSPSGPPSDIYWAEGRGNWSEADAAHVLLRRKAKKQRTIDRKRSRREKYSAEGERIRNAGELVEYIDGVWKGQVSTGGPFTLPPYLDDLLAQDLQETMRSDDELDLLFRDGSMASCIYDARNNTLNTFVVAYDGDSSFDSETLDSYDWDKTEYEKKDLEIVKPFRTAMMATMGIAAGTAAVIAAAIALAKIGGNNE